MKEIINQDKARFVLVGVFNTALDFVLLNIFVFVFHIDTLVANALSVVICMTISYFLNHYFVFKDAEHVTIKKFLTFFAVTGFSSIILQSIVIWSVSAITHSSYGRSLFIISYLYENPKVELNIAKAAAVGVGMIWNFLMYKHVVFRPKSSKQETLEDIIEK